MNFEKKYLKYKNKYLIKKNSLNGGAGDPNRANELWSKYEKNFTEFKNNLFIIFQIFRGITLQNIDFIESLKPSGRYHTDTEITFNDLIINYNDKFKIDKLYESYLNYIMQNKMKFKMEMNDKFSPDYNSDYEYFFNIYDILINEAYKNKLQISEIPIKKEQYNNLYWNQYKTSVKQFKKEIKLVLEIKDGKTSDEIEKFKIYFSKITGKEPNINNMLIEYKRWEEYIYELYDLYFNYRYMFDIPYKMSLDLGIDELDFESLVKQAKENIIEENKAILNKHWIEYEEKFNYFNVIYSIRQNIAILTDVYYQQNKDNIDHFITEFKNIKHIKDKSETIDEIKQLFTNYNNQINFFIKNKEYNVVDSYEKYYNFAICWNLTYNLKKSDITSFTMEEIQNKSTDYWESYYNSTIEIDRQTKKGKTQNVSNIYTFMSNYQLLLNTSKNFYKRYSFYNNYYTLPIKPDQEHTQDWFNLDKKSDKPNVPDGRSGSYGRSNSFGRSGSNDSSGSLDFKDDEYGDDPKFLGRDSDGSAYNIGQYDRVYVTLLNGRSTNYSYEMSDTEYKGEKIMQGTSIIRHPNGTEYYIGYNEKIYKLPSAKRTHY